MPNSEIAHLRLQQQHIAGPKPLAPAQVVAWLGAVQAQDYPAALWAVGLRTQDATEGAVERALADRLIVRTWPMRGTLHLVAAADVRWMLALLTPRVLASHAGRLRKRFEFTEAEMARCRDCCIAALEGGRHLSRDALYRELEAQDIPTDRQRGYHILWQLSQEGLLCLGPRQGKQQTIFLLDEWAPAAPPLAREQALAELARRYFRSHGPATLADFAWWSGLTTTDARAALELAKPQLIAAAWEGQTYWLSPEATPAPERSPTVHLLPVWDEYLVAYRDRSAVLRPEHARLPGAGNGIASPALVLDGVMVGTWNRALNRGALELTPRPFAAMNEAERYAFGSAAKRYAAFRGLPVARATHQ